MDEIAFGAILQRRDSVAVKSPTIFHHLEIICYLADQTGERRLANEELSRLLILSAKNAAHFSARALMASTAVYLISLSACVPGLHLWAFLTPPVMAALLRAAFTTGAFCGARPPVERRAVCLVLRTRRL